MIFHSRLHKALMPVASLLVRVPVIGAWVIKIGRIVLGLDKKQETFNASVVHFRDLDLIARLEQLEIRLASVEALSSNYLQSTPLMLRNMQREIVSLKNKVPTEKQDSN